MRRSSLRCILLTVALSTACGESSGPVSFAINVPNMRWWMEVGDTEQFIAEAREGDPTQGPIVPGVEFTWTSSNPSVLSIDAQTGNAVARRRGTSTVEVHGPGGSLGWDLTVINPIAGVVVMPDVISLLPYDRFLLAAAPADASGDPVVDPDSPLYWEFFSQMTWSTGDPAVAVIGDPEYPEAVVGVGAGTTQVTVEFLGFSGTATVTVTLIDFTDVAAGGDYTCGLTETGEPYCWGSGFFSYGSWTPTFVPRSMAQAPILASLSAGGGHACGLTPGAVAYCWGANGSGALGTGDALQPTAPVPVAGSRQYATIVAGAAHTCAVETSGQLYCWGNNVFGQLGITSEETCGGGGKFAYTYVCTRQPALVTDRPSFAALSAGGGHTCGLAADGAAFCWGSMRMESVASSPDTVRVPGGHQFASLVSGSHMACGVTTADEALCWGFRTPGLGDGSTTDSDVPVLVAGGHAFSDVSVGGVGGSTAGAGMAGACGVTASGELYCWGWSVPSFGGPTPTRIGELITWASVDLGFSHACGMSVDGIAYCWGGNYGGEVGSPGEGLILEPVRVVGQIEP